MFPLFWSKLKLAKNGGLKRVSSSLDPGRRLNPIPKPPRRTTLSQDFGFHAKPTCGPKLFRSGLNRVPPVLSPAPDRDPLEPRMIFAILPLALRIGVKYSHLRPRFSVRFGRTFQSSCANRA